MPLTQRGVEKLRAELQHLKQVERPRIIKDLAEARAHGDLKENAEYQAAREQQSFVEGRIADLESKLSMAEVIDTSRLESNGRVVFGAIVELEAEDSTETVTYQIVGEEEADIKEGLVSYTSPIARALIGRAEGDEVTVSAPGGQRRYEIIAVRFG
jgi:transcription elongation factor GreA